MEDVSPQEVYWEDKHAYCGQCGSELDIEGKEGDLVDALEERKIPPVGDYDEEDLDELDDELDEGDFIEEEE